MNKKILITLSSMLAICVAAQNIVKKCKECGKPIASCQYKGKHPTKPVSSPHLGNNGQTVHPDYSQLKIGDYFYSDGTVSRVKKNSPQPVGVVFSLNPSDNEKKRGWTHGYIMALSDAKKGRCEWGPYKDVLEIPNVDVNYNDEAQQLVLIQDYSGYEYSRSSIVKSSNGNAYAYARNYPQKLPGSTSGWFLPSVGQWCDIIKNIGRGKIVIKGGAIGFDCNIVLPNLAKYDLGTDEDYSSYWTSNESTDIHAWMVVLHQQANDGKYENIYSINKQTTRMRVRAIAAF